MSGVIAIRYLLANNAALTTKVAAVKIMAGVIPIGTQLPAIGINTISEIERTAVAMDSATVMVSERVQVTVQAKTYRDQKAVIKLVRKAVPKTRGSVNGVEVDSILPELVGPDLRDDEMQIFVQTRDFTVKYLE